MTQVAQPPYPAVQPAGQQQFVPSVPFATTLYTASGSPVQIVNVISGVSDGKYHGYKAPVAKILGFVQILLGLLIMMTQIVTTGIQVEGYQGFSGFWASAIFIIAGAFGIQSAKTKSQCSVVTTLVLCVVAAFLSIGPITQGAIGVVSAPYVCYQYSYEYDTPDIGCRSKSRFRAAIAFHVIMICCGLAEGVIAIIAAAYCCHGCCYSTPGVSLGQATGERQLAVHYQANAQSHPPQVVVSPGAVQAGVLPAYTPATPPPEYTEKA